MASIRVEELTLSYPLRGKAAPVLRPMPASAQRRIEGEGRRRFVTALRDVSFSLGAGDRLGIVGGNGSGKTTLLKVLYGIHQPTRGRVEIDGRVDGLFNINLGFRREATGRRNIELRGLINGWSRAEMAERMESIIAFSELGDFIDLPLKTYSQGMAARLAFSVATTLKPDILLMDEWIGAGDERFRQKAQQRLAEMTKEAAIVVLATHDRSLLARFCNRILELEEGRVKSLRDVTAEAPAAASAAL